MNRLSGSILVCVSLSWVGAIAYADGDAVTYTKDVAPILFDNCVRCHRQGEVAPMSLLTYDEVRPFAKSMKEKVVNGDMPPWKVDPKYGVFANDMRLTKLQIDTIAAWADGGAPRGNPADMPAAPQFGEGWQLGEPDYVVELPEQIVPAAAEDMFPNRFAMVDLPEARWVRAIEFMPGDKRVVHHVLSFLGDLRMSSGLDDQQEAEQRSGGQAEIFSVYVAGSQATVYPEGMGRMLTKKQPMTFNMHYHACGEDTSDRTKLGLYFGAGDLTKRISTTFAVNLGLQIPPGDANYEKTAFYLFDADSRIVSFLPHMHTRGKSMTYRAIYPDGREETLLNVPQYDYNWQWIYYPKEPLSVPAGTRVVVTAAYDNSEANTANPDPKNTVYYRDATFQEMFVGFMEFVADEGVAPKPAPPQKKIETLLAGHNADDSYLMAGLYGLPWGLYLPEHGDSVWYLSIGNVMFSSSLWNVERRNDGFSFESTMVTQGGGGISMRVEAKIDASGAVSGMVHLGEMERAAEPEGNQVMTMPITGRRLGLEKIASTD